MTRTLAEVEVNVAAERKRQEKLETRLVQAEENKRKEARTAIIEAVAEQMQVQGKDTSPLQPSDFDRTRLSKLWPEDPSNVTEQEKTLPELVPAVAEEP